MTAEQDRAKAPEAPTDEQKKNDGPAIEVRGLKKTFKVGFSGLRSVDALKGVDLTVMPGEIYGFLGPNGAGKSTTIKVLTKLISPTEGTAVVFGEPLDSPRTRRRVGFLPENPVFYDYLTGLEFMRYYGVLAGLSRAEANERAMPLLEQVGLAGAASLQLRRYSKGMVQRIGIAQTLVGDPDLVILDEPVSGLDPIGRREMRELILALKARGKTVFFSTHIIPDVEMICDRLGIIIAGKMVREGSVAELLDAGHEATEIVLRGISLEQAKSALLNHAIREMGSSVAVSVAMEGSVEEVLSSAIGAGARIVSVQTQRKALEDLFIDEIFSRDPGDDAPRAAMRGAAK